MIFFECPGMIGPLALLRWPDANSYLFLGGKGMIPGFWSKNSAYGQGLTLLYLCRWGPNFEKIGVR